MEDEFGTAVARWGDADYSVVLYRSSYASDFRAVVSSPRPPSRPWHVRISAQVFQPTAELSNEFIRETANLG